MKISVATVLDHLSRDTRHQLVKNIKHNTFFTGFRLAIKDISNIDKDYAYVLPYDMYPQINDSHDKYKSFFFIFTSTQELQEIDIKACRINALFIPGTEQIELYNDLLDFSSRLNDWNERLNIALVENQSIQILVNLSRDIFTNPFIIFDPGFNVLAYTDNPAKDDEGYFMIVDRGYTPPQILAEIMQLSSSHHNFAVKAFVGKGKLKSPYVKSIFPVRLGNIIVATLCMHYTVQDISQGTIDLLNHFTKKLSAWFKKSSPDNVALNHVYTDYEQLFTYILNHTIDENDIDHIANLINIPVQATFRVFVISLPSSPMRKFILNRVAERMPMLKSIIYEQCVMLVSMFSSKYRKESEFTDSVYDSLNRMLMELSCTCGSSRPFYRICDLRNAYVQASKASDIGSRIRNLKNPRYLLHNTPKTNIYEYDDLYLYHMIECTSREVTLESLCTPQLLNLLEYDEKNGSDNYKVLFTYLETSKKTAETANILHMHRNNVNYRIKRIEELFDLNLDDANLCLKLQFSFRVLDLI
ncbi:PucR family transcriptional regulator [Parasporobacterium paucivorans]|uniref:PucR C-terminal helix-turn-helix domain-containing protein n=1 Tax=Parasporobacterium paucivorans DSM 15970 TaxID=1122934 RepID=A0A1M6BZP9_9FIRM|nr:helix-turn-helix domain-containing protein [Parasporobacterium paucivorans]SHI53908.1 PucR C-terminal helix-turn-helix domain-containing protein [Parasporobacterium paucivorans DSM 15970]